MGLDESPLGEAVLVFTPPSSMLDLLRRPAPAVRRVVRVQPVDG
jgi:hypothetical protein